MTFDNTLIYRGDGFNGSLQHIINSLTAKRAEAPGHPAHIFHVAEETFDDIAHPVQVFVMGYWLFGI